MSALSLWAPRAVTPEGVRERVRLRAERGVIVEVAHSVDPSDADERFDSATLLPGLIDLQVNGGAGAAYDAEDSSDRERATQHHLQRGTTSLLATLISAPLDRLERSLERLAGDLDPAGAVVGVHLEGPFLSPEKSGAHDAGFFLDPDPKVIDRLLRAAGGGLRLLTLAPERPGAIDAIERLASQGVVVAAGHSVATAEQLGQAIDAGLSFVTHLGNASDWPGRLYDAALGFRRSEPGLVGTFLFERRLRGSLILDGLHLHPGLARALVELRGASAVALVSDATPASGLPPGRHRLGGLDAEIHEGGFATVGQGLAGSVITLLDALRVAVDVAGIPLSDAVQMASATPASILGIGEQKGSLVPGCDADILLVDPEWSPLRVYQRGERLDPARSD